MFDINLDLEIHSVTWGYYEVSKDVQLPQWFYFKKKMHTNAYPECQGLYYGFPVEQEPGGLRKVKIGTDFTPASPDHRPEKMADFNYDADPLIKKDMTDFLRHHFPEIKS